jgi:hypothetical protein
VKILILTIITGVFVFIDRDMLLKKWKSRQSIVYMILLLIGWGLALLYLSDMDVPSPVQSLEAFLDPVSIWLWGET